MRKLFVVTAIVLLSACRVSLDGTVGFLDDCSSGYGRQSSTCSGHNPGVIVIVIAPTRVYADPADALCFQLSPTPASVKTSGSYAFQNNTSSSVTIVGTNQTPWVTIAPGETSPSLSLSSAGVYNFGVQGCRGVSGTAMYGVLNVTLN